MNYLDDFKKLLTIKRYSYRTIKAYSNALKVFLLHFPDKKPESINTIEIEQFLNIMVLDKKISQAYQKILVGAIKLFFNELLRKNYKLNYLYPDRTEKKLPIVLDKSEVLLLLNAIQNIKHKSIISLIYSAGLRLGEVIEIKVNDIDSKRMLIRIAAAKGKKDRYVMLSDNFYLYFVIIIKIINRKNICLKDKKVINTQLVQFRQS